MPELNPIIIKLTAVLLFGCSRTETTARDVILSLWRAPGSGTSRRQILCLCIPLSRERRVELGNGFLCLSAGDYRQPAVITKDQQVAIAGEKRISNTTNQKARVARAATNQEMPT